MVVVIGLSKVELVIFEGFTCEILAGWGQGPPGALVSGYNYNSLSWLENASSSG